MIDMVESQVPLSAVCIAFHSALVRLIDLILILVQVTHISIMGFSLTNGTGRGRGADQVDTRAWKDTKSTKACFFSEKHMGADIFPVKKCTF